MKLILHIGKEKAGMATIQHLMANNAKQLAHVAIYYPKFPWGLPFNHNALVGFVAFPVNICPFYRNSSHKQS